jgi:hypothetical protein
MPKTVITTISTQDDGPIPWGLQQEELLRRGLAADPELEVTTPANFDFVFKTDLVVRNKLHEELPPVGVQVTTRRDAPDKVQRTFNRLKTTRAFARAIYLILGVPASRPEIFPVLARLLRQVAAHDVEGMFVVQLEEAGGQIRTRMMQTMLFNVPFTSTPQAASCTVNALNNERSGSRLFTPQPGWRKSCVAGH